MRWLVVLVLLVGCRGKPPPAENPPVIAIALVLPGGDAPMLEQLAVMPVERAVGSIAGVRAIESRVEPGGATVTVEVAPGDLERVAHEVRHVLAGLQPKLPEELEYPIVTRTRKHDEPVLWLAVRGTLPIGALSKHARDRVVPALERIPGVAGVEEHGIAEETIVIRPDLDQLAASGITLGELADALRDANTNVPGGRIIAPAGAATRVPDAVEDLAATSLGADLRLRDVATVEVGLERDATREPTLAIRAQPGAKSPEVVRAVREELAAMPRLDGVELVEVASPIPVRPRAPLVVTLFGDELGTLRALADTAVARLGEAGISDVVVDPGPDREELTLAIDRAAAAQLGIAAATIAAVVRAHRGQPVAVIRDAREQRPVVFRVPDDTLDRVTVRAAQGGVVPLSSVVKMTRGRSPSILRRDHRRTIRLSIAAPEVKLGAARGVVDALELPAGYHKVLAR